ncbi:MAG: hypothetical protein HYV32_00455 [Candidatus Kerfeldbacteria bacterium]|nr:hypothetical protein [Candidatus Kerfeldbacteria bacterium]
MSLSIDFQEYIEEQQPNKLLLLYHWDTDGLACAALFLNYLDVASPNTEVVLMHPTINNYFLLPREYAQIAAMNVDAILTTDINFPPDVFTRLEQIVQPVFVFDHHSQTAGIGKPGVQNPNYPGCSMLVNDYLMQPLSLVSVLGMVGDQEERIREFTAFYPQVEEMMKEHGLSFEEILRLTKLIDTMYIVGDTEGLEYAIALLRRNPIDALTDQRLLSAEKEIAAELARECAKEMKPMGEHVLYQPIDSRMSLISEVTRARAREFPESIIMTDHVRGDDASLYLRRRNAPIDLGCVVDLARKLGYNAGGKPEVAGVVLPAKALVDFRAQVIQLLEQLYG